MLSADDQLREVEARLVQTGGIFEGDTFAETDDLDDVAFFETVMSFPAGYRLHIDLAIDVEPRYPVWERYAFHLRGPDGRCAFRYDNESHYPAMSTFPHHKHVGPEETPIVSQPPTLAQIVAEIRAAVETA
jgi:hypothetical protein